MNDGDQSQPNRQLLYLSEPSTLEASDAQKSFLKQLMECRSATKLDNQDHVLYDITSVGPPLLMSNIETWVL